jgi:hypothetical protein
MPNNEEKKTNAMEYNARGYRPSVSRFLNPPKRLNHAKSCVFVFFNGEKENPTLNLSLLYKWPATR